MSKLVIEFTSDEMRDYFIGQMSDGFGENFCGFSVFRKKPNTEGNKAEHYERVDEGGIPVCFVNYVEGFGEDDEEE